MSRQSYIRLTWLAVWIATRALIVAQVGFWDQVSGPELEDVNVFQAWSDTLATQHTMPVEDSWQYPPGAAFLMLIPRLGGFAFGESFVATMLAVDFLGLVLIGMLATRERRETGVWVWLLAMPLLFHLPVLRFDLVPTVIGIAALVAIHRRPTLFGFLAGLGASIKVWPVVVLLAEWDRRKLLRGILVAAGTVALVFVVAALAFGDQSGFLNSQSARGLQVEAIAATPWHLRQVVTGEVPLVVQQFGTNEIGSGPAEAMATALEVLTLLVLAAAAAWWLARDRAIRRGRNDLADANVARDFVFTLVLLLVVTNKVLSPQFMIWLVGLSAVVLTAGTARLARPAWIVIAAVAMTTSIFASPASLAIRNIALLVAALDAAAAMALLVYRPPKPQKERLPADPGVRPVGAEAAPSAPR